MKNIHGGDNFINTIIFLDFQRILIRLVPGISESAIADAIGKLVIIRKCTATACEKPSGEVSYRQQSDYLWKWKRRM